jgi:DNA-binding LytR/AlgR family response regulator
MRVLIVDKEPNDGNALANVLANISEAFDMMQRDEFDVTLLNSSIRELSEFELLDVLKKLDLLRPAVIIVTTRQADIEQSTAQYLAKAEATEFIQEALTIPVRTAADQPNATMAPPSKNPVANSSKIAIATEGNALFIDPSEIIAVKAEGNYVLLVGLTGSHLIRGRISTLAELLLPYGFVQIHRCVLVNSSWVNGIHPRPTGNYVLCTRGGKEYPVSRTYKQNLRSLAPLWIGSDLFFAE